MPNRSGTTFLADALTRIGLRGSRPAGGTPGLLAARGHRVSFQACLRPGGDGPIEVRATVRAPRPLVATIRRVGHVPVEHHTPGVPPSDLDGRLPGFVPDPLFPVPVA